jgi:hypothetical protein
VYDFGHAFRINQPWFVQKLVDLKYDRVCNFIFRCAQSLSTGIRWGLRNGKWTFGAASEAEMMRSIKSYTLEEICQKITTPCLILDAENDHFLKGQPDLLRRHLSCEYEFVSLRQDEGGDTHCHQGSFFRVHQVIFDFLEKRLGS